MFLKFLLLSHLFVSCTSLISSSIPRFLSTRLLSVAGNVAEKTTDKKHSFVQDELRPYAMKLHTRDQAPREGQQKAETPFTQWQVGRSNYLQFLVDSLAVYEAFDSIISETPILNGLKSTGLERADALKQDIAWMLLYDPTLVTPKCGESGIAYSAFLKGLVKESLPRFICHYYNHYFAHTAGGRMIGKRLADQLLQGKTLRFYEWEGDVAAMLDGVRIKIDALAETWAPAEKQACLEETMECFRRGGSLMVYMKPPK